MKKNKIVYTQKIYEDLKGDQIKRDTAYNGEPSSILALFIYNGLKKRNYRLDLYIGCGIMIIVTSRGGAVW